MNDVRDERETVAGFSLLGMSLGGVGSQDQRNRVDPTCPGRGRHVVSGIPARVGF